MDIQLKSTIVYCSCLNIQSPILCISLGVCKNSKGTLY